MNKGLFELGADDGEPDVHIICDWTGRFAAAVVAILLMVQGDESVKTDVVGFPGGALITVQANRYERDRCNRAAVSQFMVLPANSAASKCEITTGKWSQAS